MGWDLKGDGFLTKYIETEADVDAMKDEIKEGAGLEDGEYYIDDLQGVVRGSQAASGTNAGNQDKIILAESDFIFSVAEFPGTERIAVIKVIGHSLRVFAVEMQRAFPYVFFP